MSSCCETRSVQSFNPLATLISRAFRNVTLSRLVNSIHLRVCGASGMPFSLFLLPFSDSSAFESVTISGLENGCHCLESAELG